MESPKDALAGLRQLLKALKAKTMKIRENSKDVTDREIAKLKINIKSLKSAVKQGKVENSAPKDSNKKVAAARQAPSKHASEFIRKAIGMPKGAPTFNGPPAAGTAPATGARRR